MRPDEVKSLTGELKPNLIDEIRSPVWPERPCRYRKMLQQPDLEFWIGKDGGIPRLDGGLRGENINFRVVHVHIDRKARMDATVGLQPVRFLA